MDQLFRQFSAGEITAVVRVRALVVRVVGFRGYYIPGEERADVVQEAMLQIWRAVSATGFSLNTSFEALVRSITYRGCVDWMRRHRPTQAIDPTMSSPAVSPDEEYFQKERTQLGGRVIASLRQPCRELFRLFVAEGMSYRQISALQGRSVGALRTQMYDCLKESRTLLNHIRDRVQVARNDPGRS
jgi:RNA polymerase sigma factor (sigma-70 family)